MRALWLGAVLAMVAGHAGAASAGDPYAYRPHGSMFNYDWSGIYVGSQVGVVHSQAEWFYTGTLDSVEQSHIGYAAGAQLGLQKQWSSTVLGVEVSYTRAGMRETSGSLLVPDRSLSSDVSNLVLVTGKLGYAWEHALAYVKAGYATANVDFRTGVTSTGAVLTTSSGRESGWTAALGLDYALTPNISIGVEYDYVRLNVGGRDQIPTPAGLAGSHVADAGVDIQMVMARVNFKFGPRSEPAVPMK